MLSDGNWEYSACRSSGNLGPTFSQVGNNYNQSKTQATVRVKFAQSRSHYLKPISVTLLIFESSIRTEGETTCTALSTGAKSRGNVAGNDLKVPKGGRGGQEGGGAVDADATAAP